MARRFLDACGKMKKRMKQSYATYSNVTNIATVIKNAFNYDICDPRYERSFKFYLSSLSVTIAVFIFTVEMILSYIYWDDRGKILMFGIWPPGIGFKKKVVIPAILGYCCVISKLWWSMKSIFKENNLRVLSNLISNILSFQSGNVHGRMADGLRPLMTFVRIITSMNSVSAFTVIFVSFIIHSDYRVTLFRLSVYALWSLLAAYLGFLRASCSSVSIFMLVMLTKHYTLTLEEIKMTDIPNDMKSKRRAAKKGKSKEIFRGKLKSAVRELNSLKKANIIMKVIIGYEFIFLLNINTLVTFMLIDVGANVTFTSIVVTPTVVLTWFLLFVVIYYLSKIRCLFVNKTEFMRKLSDEFKWKPIERCSINRTLTGLQYLNSLSVFDFIPVIHYDLGIKVKH